MMLQNCPSANHPNLPLTCVSPVSYILHIAQNTIGRHGSNHPTSFPFLYFVIHAFIKTAQTFKFSFLLPHTVSLCLFCLFFKILLQPICQNSTNRSLPQECSAPYNNQASQATLHILALLTPVMLEGNSFLVQVGKY